MCASIKKYIVNKPICVQNPLFIAKENTFLKQFAYVNKTLDDFEEISQVLGDFVFVIDFKTQ